MAKMVLVRQDGAAVRFPPTCLPLDEYLAHVRHGGWDSLSKARTSTAEPWQHALE
ncbi:hypothetical protein [Streptomyces lavendulae]|uniref:hypothetical protein n=1 Tax=Streptomyces lavendulae TaxID=1914 RepID=UPI0025573DB6|nr:hypothetical protein [Streptomyces lavendulae]